MSAISLARSFLFVPANRPERYAKALASGADAVIIDLEDSVPAAEKATARAALAAQGATLAAATIPLLVRINSLASADGPDDVAMLATLGAVAGVLVSKAEDPEALARLANALPGSAVLPLVESALGLHRLDALARAPGVVRLALGTIDFMADTGIQCDAEESQLAPLRFAVAVATRLAGLAPAVDGITTRTDDARQVHDDTLRAKRFGFGGKLCIHPKQVAPVHEAFAPTAGELAWARRVVEADAAAQGRAVQVDGRMVDIPVVELARRLLARQS